MPRPVVVIKLGGSALTDKSRIYTPRASIITRAAKQVATIAKGSSVVIVHGAGGYGHIPAKKFDLARGFRTEKQLAAVAETKLKLLEWETILQEIFIEEGVRLVPFVASSFVTARNGRIVSANITPFIGWLRLGMVPSVGGDIVPDSEMGFSIISGDQLAVHISQRLRARRLIFGIDVDGIFDSNPKTDRNARLLTALTPRAAMRLAESMTVTEPDVTGGMAGKIREAVSAVKKGIPTYFVNLTRDERLVKAASGKPVLCTRILRA